MPDTQSRIDVHLVLTPHTTERDLRRYHRMMAYSLSILRRERGQRPATGTDSAAPGPVEDAVT